MLQTERPERTYKPSSIEQCRSLINLGLLPENEAFSQEKADSYHLFAARYRNDPIAFAKDCFRWDKDQPSPYQLEIIGNIPLKNRVSARGPHGLGKTAQAAWLVWWFALTRDVDEQKDWKVITTASAWRQLEKYLWPEIHKWAKRLRWEQIGLSSINERGSLLTLALKLQHGEGFAVASDNHELIEGAHADSILYIFDESKAISSRVFDAAEGAFSTADAQPGAEAYAFAISTPGVSRGRFYEIHARKPGYEDWWVRHVTLAEAIAARRIGQQWADNRRRQWGEESAIYKNRVLGEFASNDETGIIPLEWVELANDRWEEWQAGTTDKFANERPGLVSADIARGGGDKTILAIRKGNVITELRTYDERDTMVTTGRIKAAMPHGGKIIVDADGLGAPIVDRLREQGLPTLAFHAASTTDYVDASGELKFLNARAAAWWHLRELLDPHAIDPVALPRDDELIGDLTTPQYRIGSSGKIQLESKHDTVDDETNEVREGIRKRLGRSTDKGDAVVMAFWASYQAQPVYHTIAPRSAKFNGKGAY